MTQYMEKMAIGDSIDVKGPLGHFVYKGRGAYSHSGHDGHVKQISMIAGGTGITPMWQVVQVGSLAAAVPCSACTPHPTPPSLPPLHPFCSCTSVSKFGWQQAAASGCQLLLHPNMQLKTRDYPLGCHNQQSEDSRVGKEWSVRGAP